MRILAISASTRLHLLGGMEDHLHTLMSGLAARGHEITVLTARHPDGIAEEVSDGVSWVYVDSGAHWLDASWPATSVAAARKLLAETPFDVIHGPGLRRAGGGRGWIRAFLPSCSPCTVSTSRS